jgi:hypothetical protein
VGAEAGLPGAADWPNDPDAWWAVWYAICRVWASKWNDRAWLSRRAYSVPDDELFMSVLLQQVRGEGEGEGVWQGGSGAAAGRGAGRGGVLRGVDESPCESAPCAAVGVVE